MSNYAGYEVVRELHRSPMGFDALAHAPDKSGGVYLLEVRLPDPIAAPGEERVGIDAFIAQARVQESIKSPYWVRVHAIAETQNEAIVVKDYYARSMQSLIDGRTRLDGGQLRQVAVGIVEGLIALRDQAGGRAHGRLEPSRVLLDDSAGPMRWRVLLTAPGSPTEGGSASPADRIRDRRALATLLIGLVEHRVPATPPGTISVSKRWKEVTGTQAGAWVDAINQLLDVDADPDAVSLEQVRSLFEQIRIPKRGGKGKLIVACVLAVLLAGGGGFVGWKLLGPGQGVPEPPVPTELSHEAWKGWLRGAVLRQELYAKLDPDLIDAAKDEKVEQWLSELLKLVDDAPYARNGSPSTSDAARKQKFELTPWAPERWHLVNENATYEDLLEVAGGSPESDRFWGSLHTPDPLISEREMPFVEQAPAAADVVNRWADSVYEVLSRAPGGAELRSLGDTLEKHGATRAASAVKEASALWPASAEAAAGLSIEQTKQLIDRIEAAGSARLLLERVGALEQALASVVEASDPSDPILKHASRIVWQYIDGSQGADLAALLSDIETRTRESAQLIDQVQQTLGSDYAAVHKPTAWQHLEDIETDDGTLAALQAWRRVVTDPKYRELKGAADPLRAWRDEGQADERWANLPKRIERLKEFEQQGRGAGIAAVLTEAQAAIERIEEAVSRGRSIPPIEAKRAEIEKVSQEIESLLAPTVQRVESKINELSVKYEDLRLVFEAAPAVSSVEQVNQRLGQLRQELLKRLEQVRDDPDAMYQLSQRHLRVQDSLRALDQHFDVALELGEAGSMGLNLDPVLQAFVQLRTSRLAQALQAVDLDSLPAGDATGGKDAALVSAAQELRDALLRAGAVLDELNAWRLPDEIAAWEDVSSFRFESPGLSEEEQKQLTDAYRASIEPLRSRVEAAERIGTSAADPEGLLEICRDGSAAPELQRAAYEKLDEAQGWPSTAADVQAEIEARTALIDAIKSSGSDVAEALAAQIEQRSNKRWLKAMDAVGDVATLRQLAALMSSFAGVESMLPDEAKADLLLLELAAQIGEVDRTDEEAADAKITERVLAWATEAEQSGLFADELGWISDLRKALTEESGSGGQFSGETFGPAAAGHGWQFVGADDDYTYLDYQVGSERIRLLRVPGEFSSSDPAESGVTYVWFLQSEEVSLDLFMAACESMKDREREWRSKIRSVTGPCVWDRNTARSFRPADTWIAGKGVADFEDFQLFDSDLRGEGDFHLKPDVEAGAASMPMQQLTYEVMQEFAQSLGLRLPTREAWRRAVDAQLPGVGREASGLNIGELARLGFNLRDETWRKQARHFASLFGSGEIVRPPMKMWSIGGYDDSGELDDVWEGLDDGYLLFAPTNRRRQEDTWSDLIGNVAEVATDEREGAYYVVGCSAMSPPVTRWSEMEYQLPAAFPGGPPAKTPYSDVGFRLAMRVPKDAFRQTIAQRIDKLLDDAPYSWARE